MRGEISFPPCFWLHEQTDREVPRMPRLSGRGASLHSAVSHAIGD